VAAVWVEEKKRTVEKMPPVATRCYAGRMSVRQAPVRVRLLNALSERMRYARTPCAMSQSGVGRKRRCAVCQVKMRVACATRAACHTI